MNEIDLGIEHHESGRLAQAEAVYRQILGKDPNHCDALHWLGVIAHQMGNHEAGLELITKAISINSTDPKYYNHLGMVLKGLKKYAEAIGCFQQAVAMDPKMAQAYNNLGNVFQVTCQFDDAIACYQKALIVNPGLVEAIKNTGDIFRKKGEAQLGLACYQKVKLISPESFSAHDAALSSSIIYYLSNDFESARKELDIAKGMFGGISRASVASQVYCNYMDFLLGWWVRAGNLLKSPLEADLLYVIGESHSLSLQNVVVDMMDGKLFRCQAKWIEGCKQWHLASAEDNIYKYQVSQVFSSLPANSVVLMTVGEIDCRCNEGIFPLWKNKNRNIRDVITVTVNGYLDFVQSLATLKGIRLIIGGVPATNASLNELSEDGKVQFGWFLGLFNQFLKKLALDRGMGFLDVFSMTNTRGGIADGSWHLDSHHLRPDAMKVAFEKYLLQPDKAAAIFNKKEVLVNMIKIDGREFDLNSLSETAKQNLQMLQLTEQEIQRLQLQLAIAQTARNSYANALKTALPALME